MCKDANGFVVAVNDIVTVTDTFIMNRPTLSSHGLNEYLPFAIVYADPAGMFLTLAADNQLAAKFMSSAGMTNLIVLPGDVELTRTQSTPQQFQAIKAVFDVGGSILLDGSVVVLGAVAMNNWGRVNNVSARDTFTCKILQPGHPTGCEVEITPQSPSLLAFFKGAGIFPLYALGHELVLVQTAGTVTVSAGTGQVSTPTAIPSPYQPVLAPPPDTDPKEKVFDHDSLGTDLSGDELMQTIRDMCAR